MSPEQTVETSFTVVSFTHAFVFSPASSPQHSVSEPVVYPPKDTDSPPLSQDWPQEVQVFEFVSGS